MRALLYSDWCCLRGAMRRELLAVSVVALAVTVTGGAGDALAGKDLATFVCSGVLAAATMMLSLFSFYTLFGADEREGWEQMRLTLPASRRDVVRARYVAMLLGSVAALLVAVLLGVVAGLVATLVCGGAPALPYLGELAPIGAGLWALSLSVLALWSPLTFRWGLTKARPYLMLPFFACMLCALEPVQHVLRELGAWAMGMVTRLGVAPLAATATFVILALGLSSLVASERLYATREL